MLPIRLLRGAAGSGAATYPAKTSGYSQDFNAVADGTKLYALPGWAAYDAAGVITSGADRDRVVVTGGKVTYTGSNFTAMPGAVYIGRDTGSTDHIVRWTVTTIPASGALLLVYGSTQTTQNTMTLYMVNSSGINQGAHNRNVGGTVTVPFSSAILNMTALGRSLANGDVIEILTVGTSVFLKINGYRIGTVNTLSGFTKGSMVGLGTYASGSSQQLDNFYCAPLACHLQVNDFGIFIPGTEAAGGRTFQVSGTYVGTLLDVDYRVLNASTLALVQDWRRATNQTISSGTWQGNIFVPLGDTTTNPRYVLEVRAANDTDAVDRSGTFAVGLAFAIYGQSNSDNRRLGLSASTSSNAYSYSSNGTPASSVAKTWAQSTGGCEALVQATGRPCGLFIMGAGAQSIDNLAPSGVVLVSDQGGAAASRNNWGWLILQMGLARVAGNLSGWNWTQGEAEGMAPVTASTVNYKLKWAELKAAMDAYTIANAPIGITVFGKFTGDTSANPAGYSASANTFRRVLVELVSETANAHLSHNWLNVPMVDAYHYTNAGYAEGNRRTALSWAKARGSLAYDGRGPLITGATRSGATITLAVNLNGASSLSGSTLTNYEVSTDDFATTKAITSVNVSGSTIVIVLAADPGAAVKVRSFYGIDYGTPTYALGTYADSSTIPVEPLFVPITSN